MHTTDSEKVLLEQRAAEVLGLELALKSYARSRNLSRSAYVGRLRHLGALKELIEYLRRDLAGSPPVVDMSMPLPNQITPDEHEVVLAHLHEKYEFLEHLRYNVMRVYKWIETIVRGQSLGIVTMFRLSQLRRMLMRLDHAVQEYDYDSKTLHDCIQRHLASLGLAPEEKSFQHSLSLMQRIFNECEAQSMHVAQLSEDIATTEAEIAAMENWLAYYEPKTKMLEQLGTHRPHVKSKYHLPRRI